jgi:UDP-N-acetylglucosamine:LPS N-acetylglucosamine transferase
MASAEATLSALEPDLVIATHPVAGGIAAEVSGRCGCEVAVVLPDLVPDRLWVHPGVGLWFVAGPDARDRLASRGVEWSRIAVSGVPVDEPVDPVGARQLLARAGLRDRFTALVAGGDSADILVGALDAAGIQVLIVPAPASREASRLVRECSLVVSAPADTPRAVVLAASDVVVCARCGSLAWEAPAAGVPLVVVGDPGHMERASTDLLVNVGAAMPARDELAAAERVAYLASHPSRRLAIAAAARGLGRPHATRAVTERVLAGF